MMIWVARKGAYTDGEYVIVEAEDYWAAIVAANDHFVPEVERPFAGPLLSSDGPLTTPEDMVYELMGNIGDGPVRAALSRWASQVEEGQVAVAEAKLRSLVETAAKHCSACQFSRKDAHGALATCDCDLTFDQCRSALQEWLSL